MQPRSVGIFLAFLIVATATAYPQYPDYPDYPTYDEEDVEETEADYEEPFKLPEFSVESQTIVAKEGEVANIPCTAKNANLSVLIISKETPEMFLIFAGPSKIKKRERRYKLNGESLEISQLKPSDSGIYLCKFSETPPIVLNHVLDVQYAPSVKAKTKQQQRIPKGSSVTLECEAKGNPEPVITWSKLDGRLPSGSEKEEGLSITLEDVDRHVEGSYECSASNGIGDPATKAFSVSVEYAPEIITEKESIRTGEGDQVELVCRVHARPAAKVMWTKDDQPLTLDSHKTEEQGGHRHTVKITQVTEADFGKYVCHASNTMGESSASISMTGLPKPPQFTSDPNGGEEDAYTLTWDTESFYPITAYRIKYRKAQGNDSASSESEDFNEVTKDLSEDGEENESNISTMGIKHSIRHTVSDLEPATDYEVKVEVKNKFAWSNVADFVFSTKKAEPTTTTTTTTTTSTTTTTTTTTSAPNLVGDVKENPSQSAEVSNEHTANGQVATTCTSSSLVVLGSLLALHLARRT